jgi:alkylation response protein AidB-like acyl-CoA dehydrogenase
VAIGITEEHTELAASLRGWAAKLGGLDAVRAAEGVADESFAAAWQALVEMGVPAIGLPEAAGGGGGSVLDVATALGACAHEMVPGPLLSTSAAAAVLGETAGVAEQVGAGASVAVGLCPTLSLAGGRLTGVVDVVLDAPGADLLLLGADDDSWYVVPAAAASVEPHTHLDLTRRSGSVTLDVARSDVTAVPELTAARLRRTTLTLAAAEAAGVARWCLTTAVDHARVREQFGSPIGRFQAVKHLCAEMLETVEAVEAVAWDVAGVAAGASDRADDRADDQSDAQWEYAAHVAGVVALDGAVRVAQDCIQVLGGTGFTFEHEAHFRLRRAVALRSLLGPTDGHATALADLAAAGVRRRVEVELEGRDADVRPRVREQVAAVADLPEPDRHRALAEAGLQMPHWPAPYGRDADPVTQLVIDEELAAAGVSRPDLKIGAWAAPTILAHGTDAQRERFVSPTLTGDLVWCQLFSEPGAGSDLASLRTRAERVDGGWRLTGQKVWTSLARQADWAICLARTDPDVPQHQGISYFLLDMRSEGIDIRPLREMTGDALFNEVFLDGVFVPDEMVVGEPGDGWRLARTTLANERVAMASTRLGASTEAAVSLLGPDSSAADRVRVGRAVALATVCSLLGVRTILRALAGQGPGAESSVAKLLNVRSRQDASELVVDLLGDQVLLGGTDVEEAVHEMLLTRCLSIAGGTTQVLRTVAAERILGLPR